MPCQARELVTNLKLRGIAASALLAVALVGTTPLAHADPVYVCVNDECVCIEPECLGIYTVPVLDSECQQAVYKASYTGVWHYELGAMRDPPALFGLNYTAVWTYTSYYSYINGSCEEVAYSCDVHVSDGSYFEYLRLGSSSSLQGEYKGVPIYKGELSCTSSHAELLTYPGIVLTLKGHGSRL